MGLSSSSPTTFGDILEVQKTIPAYQRDFVWDPDLREQFLENLLDAFESRDQYFIGSMVFRRDTDVYEVVDGQQRITMVYLVVSAAISVAQDEGITEKYNSIFVGFGELLSKSILLDGEPEQTPLLRHQDKQINQAYLAISEGKQIDVDATGIRMVKNLGEAQSALREQMSQWVAQKSSPIKEIAEFLNFLRDHLLCIHHVAEDVAQALTIYSRLNSTGKALTKFEVLKGLSFTAVENTARWDQLHDQWANLEKLFATKVQFGGKGAYRAIISEDTLLTYMMFLDKPWIGNARAGSPWVSEQDLNRVLLDKPFAKLLEDDANGFIGDIEKFAREVRSLRTADGNFSKDISNYLKDISAVAQTQSQWLLLGVPLSRYFIDCEEAFRVLRNMVLVFSFALTGSGTASKIYKDLAAKIAPAHLDSAPSRGQLDDVIAGMRKNIEHYLPECKHKIEHLSYDTVSHRRLIRRVFEFIEVEVQAQSASGGVSNLLCLNGKKGVNLDHLQPSNTATLAPDIQHSLGNLCLLDESPNKGLGDLPFENEKKQYNLAQSSYVVTKALAVDRESLVGVPKRCVQELKQYPKLTDISVRERTQDLIAYFEARVRA